MDWLDTLAKILSLLTPLALFIGGIIWYFLNRSKDSLTFDRAQIVTKEEWRKEVERRDAKIDALNTKIEEIRDTYEARLKEKDDIIEKLREEIVDLQDRLTNVEDTKAVRQELKDNGH